MKTIVEQADPARPAAEVIQKAAGILRAGGLVAFPTETVYGLGGNGLDEEACQKIYLAKGRPSDNPLILHISEREELAQIVREVSPAAKKLMDAFWPGPLTLIFPKTDTYNGRLGYGGCAFSVPPCCAGNYPSGRRADCRAQCEFLRQTQSDARLSCRI